MFIVSNNEGILGYYKVINQPTVKNYPKKDFGTFKIIEQSEATYGGAVCEATSQAVLKSCYSTKQKSCYCCLLQFKSYFLSSTPFSYMNYVHSNKKLGFIRMQSLIQLTRSLQSFTKFAQNVCFPFGKKNLKNTRYLSKKTTVINAFILNNLDFQNCFLSIFSFKTMYECQKLI